MWHEWNMNTNEIMMMWLTLFVNLVTSCLACMCHACKTCALCKNRASKYSSGLVCMQADSNLVKITALHFWVLNTQNATKNMPNMIPVAYLKENFMDCNENLEWGK